MDASLAARLLAEGQLVALPTETVYGLAADAANPAAVRRIFELKGRPPDHPLIVHLGVNHDPAVFGRLPPVFAELARRFWPGPLTMVVPATETVDRMITGGQDTVALRVPRHPLTLEVLQRLGRPLVAPSANRFGHTSPTTAAHVQSEFPGLPVLDGGPCTVGLESTILDLTAAPRILRPGQITRAQLEEVTGPLVDSGENAPRVPGALDRHYAPRTPARWGLPEAEPSGRWGWLGFERAGADLEEVLPDDAEGYANALYAALRRLDEAGLEVIRVQPPPREPEWEAVWDRLRRAIQS